MQSAEFFITMSSQPLTQDQLANFQDQIVRMQQFMASMQPTQPSGPSSSISGSSSLGSVPGPFREAITAIAVPPPTVLSSGGQTVQTQSFSVPSSGLITPYQSVRSLQGLGTVPQSCPLTMGSVTAASATQPFLGFNSLGVSQAGHVNQARLASSAATQPRHPDLQPRRRRARGPAVAPPSLALNSRPDVRRCVTEVFPASGPAYTALKLTIKVYPPQVCDLCSSAPFKLYPC